MAASRHVTLTQVAAAAGYSIGTVSLALRNSPLLLEETRKAIGAAAERLGYRPNPRVSALMAHIRRSKRVHQGERLAFLWLEATQEEVRRGLFSEYLKGAKARAEHLGYSLEEYWLNTPRLTPGRVERILVARGIAGVVISPMQHAARFSLPWNWANFAAAIIGNAGGEPDLHRAGFNHFLALRTLLQQLAARGKLRPVAILSREADQRAKCALSGGFIANHPAGPAKAANRVHFVDQALPELPRDWLARTKADAVITHTQYYRGWEKGGQTRGLPETFLIDVHPDSPRLAGIDQGEAVSAASAVDLVVGQLLRNERGVPEDPQALLYPGRWCEA